MKLDQLSSEMRNVRAYFYDVTTRMLCFSVGTSERVFMVLPRESLVFCFARQLNTDLESLEISCRQENSQSAFSVVACALCTFVLSCFTHPSLRTAQAVHYLSFGRWTLCLKTFHLGTVCVSLAWSSLLPRYCFCVDCLYCDLDT